MAQTIQAIRGMHDVLPDQTPLWQYAEQQLRDVLGAYGYSEIRTPIFEKTEVFARGIGEETDIVNKEMYTFSDRNGDSLSLRPEGTAGCVRACIQHNLLYNQTQRLWYSGPVFRHERPQKGRLRQFHQVSIESIASTGPANDALFIMMLERLFEKIIGVQNYALTLNYLGCFDDQARLRLRARRSLSR